MHRSRLVWILIAATLASCSKAPSPEASSEPPVAHSIAPLPTEGANVLRAKLTAGNVRSEYAAYFDANQLTRIVEHRRVDDDVLDGEYEFKGARLLHYRGAKLADSAALDLRFDLQGALLSGAGPNADDADIGAIRSRAQLLRSHALAQRATRMHQ